MAPNGAKDEEKGTGDAIADVWQLIRDYAKQETIDPLKSIGRFLGWGLPGAVFLGLGLLFATLAILRGLQTETEAHLTGSLNVIPYVVAFVVTALVAALAAKSITKPNRSQGAGR